MIDEITYEGETYRRITRNGMYYANADGKVLSLQRGQRRILKVVVIEGRPRIILRIDSRTRQFTPMRIRYAVQQGVYAEDVPNIAYVKDEQGRVTPKEERKLPDTVSFNGTEYARIPGETEYYATREGELLSFRSGKPRILAGFNRGGYRKYDMWSATLGKRSMSRNVIAYSVQKGVPLNELVGKVILQGRGGKLVPWKVKQYQRMAASTLCKKRMENPEKRIRRMKMEIQMFEDYYRTHDILPIKRYVSRMKDVLMGYVISHYGFSREKAGEYVSSAQDAFLAGVALKKYVTSDIRSYMLGIIKNCHTEELRDKKVAYDDGLAHDYPESLDEWE